MHYFFFSDMWKNIFHSASKIEPHRNTLTIVSSGFGVMLSVKDQGQLKLSWSPKQIVTL